MKNKTEEIIICQWCGQPTKIIRVHDHVQCCARGINIEECCRGEQCKISAEQASEKQIAGEK